MDAAPASMQTQRQLSSARVVHLDSIKQRRVKANALRAGGERTVHLELPNAPDVIWESTRKTQPVSIVPQGFTRKLEEVPNAQIAPPEKLRTLKPQHVKNHRGRLCPTANPTKSIWTIVFQIE